MELIRKNFLLLEILAIFSAFIVSLTLKFLSLFDLLNFVDLVTAALCINIFASIN